MSYIDLNGNKDMLNSKVLLPRESTIGTVTDVAYWSGTKKVRNPDGSIVEKPSEKIIITVKTDSGAILSCWQNAEIKKGSKPAYDTLSYTNAANLGLLEKLKQAAPKIKTLEDVAAFWRENLLNKRIKFVPETIIPEKGERYSIIKIIDSFA